MRILVTGADGQLGNEMQVLAFRCQADRRHPLLKFSFIHQVLIHLYGLYHNSLPA